MYFKYSTTLIESDVVMDILNMIYDVIGERWDDVFLRL